MNKLKTIIDLVNQGDKAKLWKYLNKGIYSKKDKIDVVKSKGGQGGGAQGKSDIVYIDMTGYEKYIYPSVLSDCIKLVKDGQTLYMLPILYANQEYNVIAPLAISVNLNKKTNAAIGSPTEETVTISEMITKMGMGDILDLPRITEEEFYTKVNSPV